MDAREWEEEQVRLDRDWYTGTESGVAGDDDYNPLAQYEDLSAIKNAEIARKQTVCRPFRSASNLILMFSFAEKNLGSSGSIRARDPFIYVLALTLLLECGQRSLGSQPNVNFRRSHA